MGKKDKFAQMKSQGGGALGSFENLVEQASAVAAIEKQAAVPQTEQPRREQPQAAQQALPPIQMPDAPRAMRLPNPQIPLAEYNLVSQYCNSFSNMTRQDFVELAIIEKLKRDGQMSEEDFIARQTEIRKRPPRGQRKGTRNQISK